MAMHKNNNERRRPTHRKTDIYSEKWIYTNPWERINYNTA